MIAPRWQLQTPMTAIVFDVDGTLSELEGIDTLAERKGVANVVKQLTAKAMGQTGISPELYQQRLDLVKPTHHQLQALALDYYQHRVKAAREVIHTFQRLGKSIYLLSAGMNPAVSDFGIMLEVPLEHIHAVTITFDQKGHYHDFDHHSLLIHNDGKRRIIAELMKSHPTLAHIGDGLNDYASHDIVTRFIGFGGVYYRHPIEALCDFYIRTLSLAPLLPLLLTPDEAKQLSAMENTLYQQGMSAIDEGLVKTS